jgi:hypothetical protein
MQFHVKINEVKTTDVLEAAWTLVDYKELLKRFDFPDADTVKDNEVKEFLFMAINDFEPAEAASIVLEYKVSDKLNEGQIENLAIEMTRDRAAENYSDIFLHKPLFEVNQLLYNAYNGKFPHIQINVIDFELKAPDNGMEMNKELVLKALSQGLSENNLLLRLFGDQLEGKVPFPEAEGIIWELKDKGSDQYTVITSEKWLTKDEIVKTEFDCTVTLYDENADEA